MEEEDGEGTGSLPSVVPVDVEDEDDGGSAGSAATDVGVGEGCTKGVGRSSKPPPPVASSSAMSECEEPRRMLCSSTGTPGLFSLANVATKSTAGERVRTDLMRGGGLQLEPSSDLPDYMRPGAAQAKAGGNKGNKARGQASVDPWGKVGRK